MILGIILICLTIIGTIFFTLNKNFLKNIEANISIEIKDIILGILCVICIIAITGILCSLILGMIFLISVDSFSSMTILEIVFTITLLGVLSYWTREITKIFKGEE